MVCISLLPSIGKSTSRLPIPPLSSTSRCDWVGPLPVITELPAQLIPRPGNWSSAWSGASRDVAIDESAMGQGETMTQDGPPHLIVPSIDTGAQVLSAQVDSCLIGSGWWDCEKLIAWGDGGRGGGGGGCIVIVVCGERTLTIEPGIVYK